MLGGDKNSVFSILLISFGVIFLCVDSLLEALYIEVIPSLYILIDTQSWNLERAKFHRQQALHNTGRQHAITFIRIY
jgi:hypothetical protein